MIRSLHNKLQDKEISALNLAEKYFDTIDEKEKKLNSFITLTRDLALEQAERVDKKIQSGEKIGPLEGIPFAVKDNIMVEGEKCTAGSKILEDYNAVYDATVIKKLKKAGGVILGKTNLDEFAMGGSTEWSGFGATKNPVDETRVPGGSSGGSAAAVAADEVAFALGSDTGGSVRQPASFCGIVGFKPTYGAVSRYGLIAMASSLDVIGPMAKNVEDAEIVFSAIKSKDVLDSTSSKRKKRKKKSNQEQIMVGIPEEYYQEGLDREIKEKFSLIQDKLENEDFGNQRLSLKNVSLPHTQSALACYYIIVPSEVSANLSRYDGIRYGGGEIESKPSLRDFYKHQRGTRLGPEVKRRIILGTFSLSSGYYEAYYKKAQEVRALIVKDFRQVFNEVDFLLTPTTPAPAFKFGEKATPLQMYLFDIYTVPANLAGLPAVSFPVGQTKAGLPIGAQLVGRQFEEARLLEVASMVEGLQEERG